MKAIAQFVRTTLVGGFLFLLPLVLVVVLLEKAIGIASKLLGPIVEPMPKGPIPGHVFVYVAAALVLLLIGFLAGLLAKTRFGTSLTERLENLILRKVPGFTLVKSMAQGSLGTPGEDQVKVAFANLDDAWVLAFIIEEQAGELLTVFVPSAPTPTAGSLFYLREDQIKRVSIPVKDAIECIMRLGVGSHSLLTRARLGTESHS